jgi:hypothetical protein
MRAQPRAAGHDVAGQIGQPEVMNLSVAGQSGPGAGDTGAAGTLRSCRGELPPLRCDCPVIPAFCAG